MTGEGDAHRDPDARRLEIIEDSEGEVAVDVARLRAWREQMGEVGGRIAQPWQVNTGPTEMAYVPIRQRWPPCPSGRRPVAIVADEIAIGRIDVVTRPQESRTYHL